MCQYNLKIEYTFCNMYCIWFIIVYCMFYTVIKHSFIMRTILLHWDVSTNHMNYFTTVDRSNKHHIIYVVYC